MDGQVARGPGARLGETAFTVARPADREMTEAEVLAWAEVETERRGRQEDDGRNALLGPPEAFSDEYASREIRAHCPPHLGPGRTGPRSQTIRGLLCRSCAGWSQPPTSEEFYEAIRAEDPDGRQECIVGVLLVEASFHELMHAYAEQAFTWRQLVRAMHRRDCSRGRKARRINHFAEIGALNGQPIWNA